jgi:hypothetical protein
MKSVEKQVLFKEKIRDGKAEDVASYEIARDECYIENVKYDWKSLQRKVKSLQIENERLQKIINKNLVPKQIKVKEEEVIKEKKLSNHDRSCSVKYLLRIIKHLQDNKEGKIKSKLSDDLSIPSDMAKEGLMFLTKYNLVCKIYKNGSDIYKIKEQLI